MQQKVRFTLLAGFLIFLSFQTESFGQTRVRIKKSEFKIENTEVKDAWKAIKAGNKYYAYGKGYYMDARKYYLEAQEYNSKNAALNYKLGVCFLNTDNKFEAIKYFKTAYGLDNIVADDIHLMLARAYHLVLDFENAIKEYQLYKKGNVEPVVVAKINKYLAECENGKILTKEPLRVIINNLGEQVNSEYDDYNSVFTRNEKLLYFTSRRPLNEKSDRSTVDSKFFEDIYKSAIVDNNFQQATRIDDKKLNGKKNKDNMAIVGISPDGGVIYVYKGNEGNGDIFYSEFVKGKWKSAKPFKKINTNYKETSLCFSSDGNTLYYTSSDKKLSNGGLDIFVTKKDSKGKWEKPKNLSPIINTIYNEQGVFISADGNTLYFSSEGHNSMGGLDIFKTTKDETGVWTAPVNLGYPINSVDDDVFYVASESGKYGYYSGIRDNGLGAKDIFKVIFLGEEKEHMLITEDVVIAGLDRELPSIFFESPTALVIDEFFMLQGTVTDASSGDPVVAKLEIIDLSKSEVVKTALSDKEGKYTIKLPEKNNYGIEISSSGYMLFLDAVDLMQEVSDEMAVRNFELEKVEVGQKVVLENIFFEFGKSTLKPESYTQLSQVKKLLENSPTMRIEISGHTDNVGSLKSNTKISTDRAKAVTDWLIAQGIDKTRIEYKGYAFSQPIAPNDTEAGRQQNRRVEFKILSK